MSGEFTRSVRAVLAALPPGEVLSYGEVAREAGHPGAARAVGAVLAHGAGLPWWRVVAADGRLVPGLELRQARLLAGEGVATLDGRVARAWMGDPRPRGAERGRRAKTAGDQPRHRGGPAALPRGTGRGTGRGTAGDRPRA